MQRSRCLANCYTDRQKRWVNECVPAQSFCICLSSQLAVTIADREVTPTLNSIAIFDKSTPGFPKLYTPTRRLVLSVISKWQSCGSHRREKAR